MKRFWLILPLLLLGLMALAQRWREPFDPSKEVDRKGIPDWEVQAHMPDDVFTFVRIQYESWSGRGGGWRTDYPDSDLNFSYRLQELTSMEVNPDGKILQLTDPELFDHPFAYMIEPGSIMLSDEEVANLRRYLLNGGFLMIDDFWGDNEWQGLMEGCMDKVFPDRKWVELELDHPVFHCVFELKEKPQVPALQNAIWGRPYGITWEDKPGAEHPGYRAYFDDDGRMVCIICWNTDLGDGWEREGEDEWYFREFAEKKAYPMGINILFYALTH